MAEKEHDTLPADDLDIEIVDLDQPGEIDHRRPSRRFHLTRRQRAVGTVFTALLFVVVISVLLVSISGVGDLVTRTFFPPNLTATATSRLGRFSLYLSSNPSWGQFTVDGQPLKRLPVPGRDNPLNLAPGRHEIGWRAAPFSSRVCIFTVVDRFTMNSPCLQNSSISMSSFSLETRNMHILSFFASLKDLPGEQQHLLAQQIQKYLDGYSDSETVAPGERYAVSEQAIQADPALCTVASYLANCFARAKEPLRATFSLQLDTSTSRDDPCVTTYFCSGNDDCRQLCGGFFWMNINQAASLWEVSAIIYSSWSYATLSGKVVARDQPVSSIRGSQLAQQISLEIAWDKQGWHVASPSRENLGYISSDPACDRATQNTMQFTDTLPGNTSPQMYVQQAFDFPNHIAAGCLVIAGPEAPYFQNPLTPTPGPQKSARFLSRFGVVLAVNDVAHRNWPFLPVANAHEQEIARQLQTGLQAVE